jgi:hypothetical protein
MEVHSLRGGTLNSGSITSDFLNSPALNFLARVWLYCTWHVVISQLWMSMTILWYIPRIRSGFGPTSISTPATTATEVGLNDPFFSSSLNLQVLGSTRRFTPGSLLHTFSNTTAPTRTFGQASVLILWLTSNCGWMGKERTIVQFRDTK